MPNQPAPIPLGRNRPNAIAGNISAGHRFFQVAPVCRTIYNDPGNMTIDRIDAFAALLRQGLHTTLPTLCAIGLLAGCGGEADNAADSDVGSAPAPVDEVPGTTDNPAVHETPVVPDTEAPEVETTEAPDVPPVIPDDEELPSVTEEAPEDLPPAGTPSVDPTPVAATSEKPAMRPRVVSPIDKLPPPEKEMTPPPPRTSAAAAELASRKSEEAGKAYMAFLEATSTAERIKWIRQGAALRDQVEEYHTTHEQSDFKVTETQIMGAGRRLDDPTKFVFPYYVATTKNPFGFLVLVYEEDDGMKLSWEQFVLGQDYPLHEFMVRQDTTSYEFLGAITQAHIFDPAFTEKEKAGLIAVNLDLPRVALADKPIAYADRDSAIGEALLTALPWGKRQLCRIGLKHGANGKLQITSYAKLAHPN